MVLVNAASEPVSCDIFAIISEKVVSTANRGFIVSISTSATVLKATSKALYLAQQEIGIVSPDVFDVVGSDDATTCVICFIRNPQTGAVCCLHYDAQMRGVFSLNSFMSSLGPVSVQFDV